jgi:xylan 1,4-beta-xylosidase
VRRIWTSLGYDELNWTHTPAGKRALGVIGALAEQPYYVRQHYIFNSGIGWSIPHWGAGNVYHEAADGTPFYDFAIADQVYDAVVHAGHRPLVELAFTPRALVPDGAETRFAFEPSPTQWSPYEAGLWAMPPKDYAKWGGLVRALVEHCVARYGAPHVRGWLWELWNEPDIYYWRGTPEQFHALYDVTAAAVKAALPDARGRPGHHRRPRHRPPRPRLPARLPRALRAAGHAARLRLLPHQGRALHALAGVRAARRPGTAAAVALGAQDAARGAGGA